MGAGKAPGRAYSYTATIKLGMEALSPLFIAAGVFQVRGYQSLSRLSVLRFKVLPKDQGIMIGICLTTDSRTLRDQWQLTRRVKRPGEPEEPFPFATERPL